MALSVAAPSMRVDGCKGKRAVSGIIEAPRQRKNYVGIAVGFTKRPYQREEHIVFFLVQAIAAAAAPPDGEQHAIMTLGIFEVPK